MMTERTRAKEDFQKNPMSLAISKVIAVVTGKVGS